MIVVNGELFNLHRFAKIFAKIIVGFKQLDGVQFPAWQLGIKGVPKHDGKIFYGRDNSLQKINIVIQVLMVNFINNFRVQNIAELLEVNHVTGFWVGLASNSYLKHVIVSVSARVVAFIKDGVIALVCPIGIVQAVRGGKVFFASNVHHAWRSFQVGKCGGIKVAVKSSE
jgi:hypothetical protein